MRLWVDDLRPAPEGWTWAIDSHDAIVNLLSYPGEIDEISFDHDLGDGDTTRKVILWMCENDIPWPAIVRVHTANPVGREWLEGMVNRYGPGVTR